HTHTLSHISHTHTHTHTHKIHNILYTHTQNTQHIIHTHTHTQNTQHLIHTEKCLRLTGPNPPSSLPASLPTRMTTIISQRPRGEQERRGRWRTKKKTHSSPPLWSAGLCRR